MNRFFVLLLVMFLGISTLGIFGCGGGGSTKPPGENIVTPYPIPDDNKPPDPPRNISAIASDGSATLSWTSVFSAVGYHIYQSRDGITFLRLTAGVSFINNTAILGDLENGRTYYFGVSAVDEHNNESGIAYVGGDGRNPKAFPVVPNAQVSPNPWPEPPTGFTYVTGDRRMLLRWEPSPTTNCTQYSITRYMSISPFANVGGNTQKQKDLIRQAYQDYFAGRFFIPASIKDNPGGFNEGGFTIAAGPYYVDNGVWPVGVPPNYLPLGLAQGDISYGYKLFAWGLGNYSVAGGTLENLVPLDLDPDAPQLLGLILVPKATGTGIGVYMEWTEPIAPTNSDIKQYVLTRIQSPELLTISLILNKPFNPVTPILTYQDDTVIAGKTYLYQVFAEDYTGHASLASNTRQITIPGGEAPPP